MTISEIKKNFPIFTHYPNLVYLDNAATSQKPLVVIDRMSEFYQKENANIHRGIYELSEQATSEYEAVREKVARFIGAKSAQEVIFTSGTTESINLVVSVLGQSLEPDDEIVVTEMEHHSNLLPWMQIVQSAKFKVKSCSSKLKIDHVQPGNNLTIQQFNNLHFIPVDPEGQLDLSKLDQLINQKTKIVALTYISNVLGTINPVKEIIRKVKAINPKCLVLVDAAQAVPHLPVNVIDLDCDFLAFSGHKMCGPTGVGVLWARQELLEEMEPYQTGGGMIERVDLQTGVKWAAIPQKFEAGTPNIAGVIGLGAAIDFLNDVGMAKICQQEAELTAYALEKLQEVSGIEIYGSKELEPCGCSIQSRQLFDFPSAELARCARSNSPRAENQTTDSPCGSCLKVCKNRLGIISFNLDRVHAHDVAQVLADQGIAVRAGHHCAMPLHQKLGVPASVRMSLYLYNSRGDVERLVGGLEKVQEILL